MSALMVVALLWLSLPTVVLAAEAAGSIDCRVRHSFSSEGSISRTVSEAIRQTKERIVLALYGFNNDELADELVQLSQRGIKVQLKIDSGKADGKRTAWLVELLKKSGVQVTSVAADGRNHNKFAVIDGSVVLTGSYNWTRKAEGNWENLLILDCPSLARRYEAEWEKIH